MRTRLNHLAIHFYEIFQEDGQDLVEYALVLALICFAATAGMLSLASSINGAFANISTKLTIA